MRRRRRRRRRSNVDRVLVFNTPAWRRNAAYPVRALLRRRRILALCRNAGEGRAIM